MGYADGWLRDLSNRGFALFDGVKVSVGKAARQTVMITNNGTVPVKLGTTTITGANAVERAAAGQGVLHDDAAMFAVAAAAETVPAIGMGRQALLAPAVDVKVGAEVGTEAPAPLVRGSKAATHGFERIHKLTIL